MKQIFPYLSRRYKHLKQIYRLVGLDMSNGKACEVDESFPAFQKLSDLTFAVLLSKPILDVFAARAFDLHLYLIHNARLKMIRSLLPPANVILDLGGAYAPLHKMGYPHDYQKLTLIDLPPENRHEEFQREVPMDEPRVFLRYEDMTKLEGIDSSSIDLVWSGQSIEHITVEQAVTMCSEILRVLKPGGSFCLDTPNGLISSIHAATVGAKVVHPDHKIEYSPQALQDQLRQSGFEITVAWGICEMPFTQNSKEFCYDDFLNGGAITANVEGSYIQFIHAKKPVLAEVV